MIKEMCKSIPKKPKKMDAYNETRQKIFAAASVNFPAAKYGLAATSDKPAATKVLSLKGQVEQIESTRCSENWSRCSDDTSS